MNRLSYWRFRKPEVKIQKIKKFFILDFEATCDRGGTLQPPEIIEFPCIKTDATTMEIEQVFHRYVRPRLNKILTPFCTDLTGVMQEMVDNEPEFDEVLKDFCEWLKVNFDSTTENESIFVTCGNWDLMTMLPEQCRLSNVEVPQQMLKWINLKMTECGIIATYTLNKLTGSVCEARSKLLLRKLNINPQSKNLLHVIEYSVKLPCPDKNWVRKKSGLSNFFFNLSSIQAFCSATGFWPQSLAAMFRYLEKPMHGKYHSGINDCRNMLLVMKELKDRNYVFEQTNSLDQKG